MRILSLLSVVIVLSTLLGKTSFALATQFDATDAAKKLLKNLGVKKGLIINADDLGLSIPLNQGILKAWDQGVITSMSLQTVEIVKTVEGKPVEIDPVEDAFRVISQRENLDIGLHLTIHSTDGFKVRPVSPADKVPSLVDDDGFFKSNKNYYLSASKGEIKAEMKAQIEKALGQGIELTHVNCHLSWCHVFAPYKRIYAAVAGEYNLVARWPFHLNDKNLLNRNQVSVLNRSIRHFVHFSKPKISEVTDKIVKQRKARFLKKINSLPLGISEILFHPVDKGIAPAWRKVDYLVLTDREVKAAIASKVAAGEFALIGFRDVKKVMDEDRLSKVASY